MPNTKKHTFLASLKQTLESTRQMCFVVDSALQYIWASESCLREFPALLLPDGVDFFLLEYNTAPLHEQEPAFPLTIRSSIGVANALELTVFPHYTEEGERLLTFFLRRTQEQANTHPEDLSTQYAGNAAALFTSNYRSDLFHIFSALTLICQTARGMDDVTAASLLQYTQAISRQCYRLLRKTINIAALLAYYNGASSLPRRNGDLAAWLRELCLATQDVLRSQPVKLNFSIPEEPVITSFSPDDMATAVLGLVLNALHAPLGETPVISVALHCTETTASIAVADNGAGMNDDTFRYAFRPFYTYDPAGGPYAGLGLGLSAVKAILGMHGGSVHLTSRENEGTTVSLLLPLAPNDAQPPITGNNHVEYLADRFSPLYVHLCDFVNPPPQ